MGNVKLRVWDVKHGNAIFIKTPNDKNLVFDLGRGDYSEKSDDRSPLETLYSHYGVRTIDFLMVTHPHRDHIDDILNIGKFNVSVFHRPRYLDQSNILSGVSERDRPKFDKYFDLNNRYTESISGSNRDTSVPENYGGIKFSFFSTPLLPENNLNNHSILTVLEYEGLKIIIPGDNENSSLESLMKKDDFKNTIKDCNVLIAPHHGRDSAYHNDFVTLANPWITIISDGSICDTSANQKYSAKSQGYRIYKNGQFADRKLLTTNSDGEIYIDFGRNLSGRYLNIQIK